MGGFREPNLLARVLPRVIGRLFVFRKIVGSQHHGSVGLGLLFEELTRRSLFNHFAQPHKLIYALIWPNVTPTFKIVHRRSADRAQNYFALIEHRELNDRPIEVVAPDLALLQRHCKCSITEGLQPIIILALVLRVWPLLNWRGQRTVRKLIPPTTKGDERYILLAYREAARRWASGLFGVHGSDRTG
jgi:hypothetical protein